MSSQSKPTSAQTQYSQMLISWAFKGIAFFTTTPEALNKTGHESVALLDGFHYSSGHVKGSVDPVKVREVIKQAMAPIKRFFRAGIVITASLFFASRAVFFLPVAPSALLVLSGITAMITWDVHAAVREMNHAFAHFNRLHIASLSTQEASSEIRQEVTFEQFVGIIDSYSQQIFSSTWLLSGSQTMEDSLTSWREHLTEQVRNQSEESKKSPREIAAVYFPILPIICRVVNAADSATHNRSKEE